MSSTTQTTMHPFKQGKQAWNDLKKPSDNPWPVDSIEFFDWLCGWWSSCDEATVH